VHGSVIHPGFIFGGHGRHGLSRESLTGEDSKTPQAENKEETDASIVPCRNTRSLISLSPRPHDMEFTVAPRAYWKGYLKLSLA
jgi:hypothetical protein